MPTDLFGLAALTDMARMEATKAAVSKLGEATGGQTGRLGPISRSRRANSSSTDHAP